MWGCLREVNKERRIQMTECLQKQDEIDPVFNLLTLQLGKDVTVAVKAKMVKWILLSLL